MDNSKQTFQGIFVLSLPPGPDFCVFCCNLPRLRASAVFLTERQELSIFELHRRRVSSQNQKSSANMNLSLHWTHLFLCLPLMILRKDANTASSPVRPQVSAMMKGLSSAPRNTCSYLVYYNGEHISRSSVATHRMDIVQPVFGCHLHSWR